jgi:WD40 repeat protein
MTVLKCQVSGRTLSLVEKIASSGEGTVWITSYKGFLAKLYHQSDPERFEKLRVMIAHPPQDPMQASNHISLAWPKDILANLQGQPQGFLMPEVGKSVKLSTIYNPRLRSRKAPRFNWYYLHTAALNIASTMESIHREDYVVGDVKPQNILVNNQALISIIDTDSFQVRDPHNRHIYRCLVGSEGFTPPELLGKDIASVDQTEIHDRFRLGVIIFLLLFGDQPFKGKWIGRGESPQPTALIEQGFWPYAPQSLIRPGPNTIPLSILHSQLQSCFHQCFTQGHTQPHLRPSAQQWMIALKKAIANLKTCQVESNHYFSRSYGHCYWCDRKSRVGIDIFSPNPVILKPAAHRSATKHPRPKSNQPTHANSVLAAAYAQRMQQLQQMQIPPSGMARSILQMPLVQRPHWPIVSNSVLGLVLCIFSFLGLGLLLAPELNPQNFSNWSKSLDRAMDQWLVSKLGFASHQGANAQTYPSESLTSTSVLSNPKSLSQGHWDTITTLAISPNSAILVSGSRDFTLKIWNLKTGQLLHTLSEHFEPVVSSHITDGGKALISSSNSGKVLQWDLDKATLKRSFVNYTAMRPEGGIRATVVDPKSRMMASSAWGGSILLYNLKTDKVTRIPSALMASEQAMAISADARTLVTSNSDGQIQQWNIQTGQLQRRLPNIQGWQSLELTSAITLSNQSKTLITGSWGGMIGLWDLPMGRLIKTFPAHAKMIVALAVSVDDKLLISGGEDQQIKIWNLSNGKLLRTLSGHQNTITALAISPNNQWLVSGSSDRSIKIWNLTTGQLVRTLSSP